MSDLEAIRALVEVARGDGGQGTLACCVICGERSGDHAGHCPVPAAEAALDRLEKEAADDLSWLRDEGKQEGLYEGYEAAREQALLEARARERTFRSLALGSAAAAVGLLADWISAMTPKGGA